MSGRFSHRLQDMRGEAAEEQAQYSKRGDRCVMMWMHGVLLLSCGGVMEGEGLLCRWLPLRTLAGAHYIRD